VAISAARSDQTGDHIEKISRDKDFYLLRYEVGGCFSPRVFDFVIGNTADRTECAARSWLMRAGNRWRSFAAVAAFGAIHKMPSARWPDTLRKIAMVVECCHKASLLHDDIEYNDQERHGQRTLHADYGVPFALNVGDLLIGESYRLIGGCSVPAGSLAKMLAVATQGQRELCRGQGAELCGRNAAAGISSKEMISIFRKNTAPAFEVALRLGVILAGAHYDDQIAPVVRAYSEGLGIAHQIRDDLDEDDHRQRMAGRQPTRLLSVAKDRARGK
jgi:geranylgeranyl pyrophosphate synthase